MSGRKNMGVILGVAVSVSLIVSTVSALFVTYWDSRIFYRLLHEECGEMAEYAAFDFLDLYYRRNIMILTVGFLAGMALFFLTFWYRNEMENRRIREIGRAHV